MTDQHHAIKHALNNIDRCANGIYGITAALIAESRNFYEQDDYECLGHHALDGIYSGLQELANQIQTLTERVGSQID